MHLENPVRRHPLLTAAGVGALAGMRTMAVPTPVVHAQNYKGRGLFIAPASFEMIGDKLPFTANRISPLQFSARVASGAISAVYVPLTVPSRFKNPVSTGGRCGGDDSRCNTFSRG